MLQKKTMTFSVWLQYLKSPLKSVLVVTISVQCMRMHARVARPSGFLWAITCTFMHGFQNNLAQVFSLTSTSAV